MMSLLPGTVCSPSNIQNAGPIMVHFTACVPSMPVYVLFHIPDLNLAQKFMAGHDEEMTPNTSLRLSQ